MRCSVAIAISAAVLALAACKTYDNTPTGTTILQAPTDLTYQLLPSGDPSAPEGIELRWAPTTDANVSNYAVYSRGSTTDQWSLRAQTTSAAFEDLGTPDLQYYVTAQASDGSESQPSNTVTVSASDTLPAPAGLVSISLNQAVQLSWSNNARAAQPSLFSYYRVYSTAYNIDQNLCDTTWALEGTTVSEDFISSGLPNGRPVCFTVSAISTDGHESQWSQPRGDTPRYDARNVLVYTAQARTDSSGFSFFVSGTNQLGAVLADNNPAIDFRLDQHSDGSIWMTPMGSGTSVTLYSTQPIDDLTSIDLAPENGFSTSPIQAVPGFGYVYQMTESDGLHFGGLRVTYVASNYMIFDWSYQSDPGNPELDRVARRVARK